MRQRARGVGIHLVQAEQDPRNTRLSFGCGFGAFHGSSCNVTPWAAFGGSLASGFHFEDYATRSVWPRITPAPSQSVQASLKPAGTSGAWSRNLQVVGHVLPVGQLIDLEFGRQRG